MGCLSTQRPPGVGDACVLSWGPEGVKGTTAPEGPRDSAVVETVLESPGSLRRPAETAWARPDAEMVATEGVDEAQVT